MRPSLGNRLRRLLGQRLKLTIDTPDKPLNDLMR